MCHWLMMEYGEVEGPGVGCKIWGGNRGICEIKIFSLISQVIIVSFTFILGSWPQCLSNYLFPTLCLLCCEISDARDRTRVSYMQDKFCLSCPGCCFGRLRVLHNSPLMYHATCFVWVLGIKPRVSPM